jgi:hypothetical protein
MLDVIKFQIRNGHALVVANGLGPAPILPAKVGTQAFLTAGAKSVPVGPARKNLGRRFCGDDRI